ncbi:MAG TPA: hypothetical protein VLI54_06770 [Bacillota bacterium]|nr:hypothetical protein [Bacillota bacterium]
MDLYKDQCAQDGLVTELLISGRNLPEDTVRTCDLAVCTGAAILRPGELSGKLIPAFGNPDGTLREDVCPSRAKTIAEVEAGFAALDAAIRQRRDNPENS